MPRPIRSALDRRPPLLPTPRFHAPLPAMAALSNGIPVWFLERPGLPLVSLRLMVQGGSGEDPAHQAGLSALTDTLLTRGAASRDALAFATLTEQLALSLGVSTDDAGSVVSLDAHADHLSTGLELMTDAVLSPHLAAEEVARTRSLRAAELARDLDDPASVARGVALWAYHGSAHPWAHPPRGTRAGVERIDADAVRASHTHRFRAEKAHLIAVGDVSAGALIEGMTSRLGAWLSREESPSAPVERRKIAKGPALYLVDNPSATQSVLYVLGPAPSAHDPRMHGARMALIALGGTFTSRLNQRLREEKGYTYGVHSRLAVGAEHSTALTSTAVQSEATGPALKDLVAEIKRLRRGIRADELDKARAARQTQLVAAFEPRGGAADALSALVQTGRGPTGFQDELAALSDLSVADVRAATGGLGLDQAVIVVVGDLATVRGPVEAAVKGDWTVVNRDPWT